MCRPAPQVFVSMVPLLGAISFAVGSTVKQTVDASVFLFVVGVPCCLHPCPNSLRVTCPSLCCHPPAPSSQLQLQAGSKTLFAAHALAAAPLLPPPARCCALLHTACATATVPRLACAQLSICLPACLPAHLPRLPAMQTHPYDVGDIILFNDAWHRVEEITLPATVFLRTADSAKIW